MAIGSVKELVDYRSETVKIAQEYGRKTDLGLIADNYDPNHSTSYPNNDMVIYDEKLYRSNQSIPVMIGEFDETMWSEIPDYDSTVTYQGTQKVVHEGTPYSKNPMVPSVTGEWDSSYWIEITPTAFADYDATATTPPQALKIEDSFYETNSDYEPTGGVGEFDSTKWTETTVEEVITALQESIVMPQSYIQQLCTAGDIRTDANGYVTNTLNFPPTNYTLFDVYYYTTQPIIGVTCMVQIERGCISGVNQIRLRLVDASGQPLASITEGISDMGAIMIRYITI